MARKQNSKRGAPAFLTSLLQDKRKLIMTGGVALAVIIFIIFLSSLGSDDEKETQAASDAPAAEQGVTGTLAPRVPASQRYDYSNILNDELPAAPSVSSDLQGSAPVQDDPFATMRPQTPPPAQGQAPAPDAGAPLPPPPPPAAQTGNLKAYLYCGAFSTEPQAQEQKALIAFQGQSSQVVRSKEGSFQLKIGPFDNRDQARAKFNELGSAGLVERCALVDE